MTPAEHSHICVVVPVYNEEAVLGTFHSRLGAVLDQIDIPSTVVYVDDGSTDGTPAMLADLLAKDERVGVITLSRNFGHDMALTAGIDLAEGDALIVMDADGQDPPEIIPELVARWLEGYDVVFGTRVGREGESLAKRASASMFYRLMHRVSKPRIPADTGDFRLLSRRAADALKHVRERHRYLKGLFAWIGYRQTSVPYKREPRIAGSTKWSYWRLWNYALDGVTAFTTAPLRLATYLGLITAMGAFIYGVVIIVRTLLYENPVPGYPSLMVVILFLGGIQLVAIGIIGEYLGRLFNESKKRPLYLVESIQPARAAARIHSDA